MIRNIHADSYSEKRKTRKNRKIKWKTHKERLEREARYDDILPTDDVRKSETTLN